MDEQSRLSRRNFIKSAAALSFIHLPGIGRIQARPAALQRAEDYTGRLCYNENPLGPSPLAITAMNENLPMAHRYPDWFSSNLENVIAAHHDLQQSNICVGAGATEVIRLVADAFLGPGDEMLTATPTYSQMATDAIENGATVVHVPLDENHIIDLKAISDAMTENTRMVSLVNPNNPVATIINKSDMESFINTLPRQVIVVIDEAYHHYVHSDNYESCIRYVKEGKPVVVVRTFSKAYGLAGARIGYSVASASYTNQITASQLFGTVSNLGQTAAEASLKDNDHVTDTIALNDEAKGILKAGFENLRLEYIHSHTNFMMFNTGSDGENIASQLAARGYQVRTGWGMPSYIRISTGLVEEMNGFIDVLGEIIGIGGIPESGPPNFFGLKSVYPNPFNSQCEIEISTKGIEKTTLSIYDLTGRRVITLLNQYLQPGIHRLRWDGKDISNRTVSSGVYIINLIQGELADTQRAVLVR